MDLATMWPMLLAAILAPAGLATAWWWHRSRAAAAGGHAPRRAAKPKAGRRGNPADESLDTIQAWEPTATRVLTGAEREAYHVLRKALPDHMVLAQVPVARFIKVPTRNSYSEWLRRVGSLCADLVVCDMASQVVAVVEVRQPFARENERAQKRQARMDRVLSSARIPVHVWLEGALPGPAVAREAILGSALNASGKSGYPDMNVARRDAEAAAVVASMQMPAGAMQGVSVDETSVDFNVDDWADEDGDRKEPPPSTWFDDLDSGPVPLDTARR
jgi:hypothetical protein